MGKQSRTNTLAKLVVFGDPSKGPVAEAIAEFSDFLQGKAEIIASCSIERCTTDVLGNSDFAVVFGGDGSIISAARDLSQAHVPVIGVNMGKLGFLAEFNLAELKRYFDDILAGKLLVETRMLLAAFVEIPTALRHSVRPRSMTSLSRPVRHSASSR